MNEKNEEEVIKRAAPQIIKSPAPFTKERIAAQ
jgi:hypothetical protein